MPISCPLQFASLSTDEMRDLDRAVMRCAFDVHCQLGRLCDEFIYKNSFLQQLKRSGFEVDNEVPIEIVFEQFVKTLYIDSTINRHLPYELKVVRQLTTEHETQLLIYMLLVNANRGKLINFRSERVESRFVNAPITWDERHRFKVVKDHWNGDPGFCSLVESLIHDWGTCLSSSLYTQAIEVNLGGVETVVNQLPLSLTGEFVGNQKFRLFTPDTAFKITTFNRDDLSKQKEQIVKLMAATQLQCMYWVNVGRHEVIFDTIRA